MTLSWPALLAVPLANRTVVAGSDDATSIGQIMDRTHERLVCPLGGEPLAARIGVEESQDISTLENDDLPIRRKRQPHVHRGRPQDCAARSRPVSTSIVARVP